MEFDNIDAILKLIANPWDACKILDRLKAPNDLAASRFREIRWYDVLFCIVKSDSASLYVVEMIKLCI